MGLSKCTINRTHINILVITKFWTALTTSIKDVFLIMGLLQGAYKKNSLLLGNLLKVKHFNVVSFWKKVFLKCLGHICAISQEGILAVILWKTILRLVKSKIIQFYLT